MNYYNHHLGDYAAATAHLSWDEDMAYTRLIRAYYHHEKPIPLDIKEACRLVRATSPRQREAVASVLREFFDKREDGWHQARCDEEIAKYQDKSRKAKGSANARWKDKQTHTEGNANASANALRPQSEGNAPNNQYPIENIKEGADAPSDIVWKTGVRLEIPRSFLGKLCKNHGTERVAAAVVRCDEIRPADPKSYLASLLAGDDVLDTAR